MIRLFLLYAILIFAKKAPQLIKDLLNIKGDNIGLKGLSIKNKMGEAALIGDKVKKGMNSLEGKAKGTLGGAAGGLVRGSATGFMSTTGLKNRLRAAGKTAKDAGLAGASKGFAKGKHDAAQNGDTKGIFGGAYKEMGDIASGGRTSLFNKPKEWLQQQEDKFTKGVPGKDNRFANPQRVENQIKLNGLKADLTKRYGAERADKMLRRAYSKAEGFFGEKFDISKESHWMYLTSGQVFDTRTGRYKAAIDGFKGLKDAVDYSGAKDEYLFDNDVSARMNTAYRYSNIATNIDKKRSAFDTAYQNYSSYLSKPQPQKEPGETDAQFQVRLDEHKAQVDMYREVAEAAFGKFMDSLKTAGTAKLINVQIGGGKINGADMKQFAANIGNVDTELSKQISALKANTDSMVQKEEIKQKTDDGKK